MDHASSLRADRRGVTSAEYTLILTLVTSLGSGAWMSLGDATREQARCAAAAIAGIAGGSCDGSGSSSSGAIHAALEEDETASQAAAVTQTGGSGATASAVSNPHDGGISLGTGPYGSRGEEFEWEGWSHLPPGTLDESGSGTYYSNTLPNYADATAIVRWLVFRHFDDLADEAGDITATSLRAIYDNAISAEGPLSYEAHLIAETAVFLLSNPNVFFALDAGLGRVDNRITEEDVAAFDFDADDHDAFLLRLADTAGGFTASSATSADGEITAHNLRYMIDSPSLPPEAREWAVQRLANLLETGDAVIQIGDDGNEVSCSGWSLCQITRQWPW